MSDLDSLSYEFAHPALSPDCSTPQPTGHLRKRKPSLTPNHCVEANAVDTQNDSHLASLSGSSVEGHQHDENVSFNRHTHSHPRVSSCKSLNCSKKIRLADPDDENTLLEPEGDILNETTLLPANENENCFRVAHHQPESSASFITSAAPKKHAHQAHGTSLHPKMSRECPELSDGDSDVPDDELYIQPFDGGNCSNDGYLTEAAQNEHENGVEGVSENDEQEAPDVDGEVDIYEFMGTLPPIPSVFQNRPPCIPPRIESSPAVTLVLDLDETLVHCSIEPTEHSDFTFPVHFGNQDFQVYAQIRPVCSYFLEQVSKYFEVVIFTASQQVYADKVLDVIDPQGLYITHRVFRDDCVVINGNYIKDLSVLGRSMGKVAIVDNSPQAFGYQVDNGIPIESWYGEKSDRELLCLLPFLLTLSSAKDVRPHISERFGTYDHIFRGRVPPEHLQRRFYTAGDSGDEYESECEEGRDDEEEDDADAHKESENRASHPHNHEAPSLQ